MNRNNLQFSALIALYSRKFDELIVGILMPGENNEPDLRARSSRHTEDRTKEVIVICIHSKCAH